jgi:hypothetical protein
MGGIRAQDEGDTVAPVVSKRVGVAQLKRNQLPAIRAAMYE